ncbi:MAG: gluconate 2-dehydrogenase subunit 3 family protein [Bacteroidota bacterium]
MQRRDAMKRMAWSTGGVLSIPTLSMWMSGCQVEQTPDWVPSFFSQEQIDLVAEIAETIIPTTDSPGAKEALVHRYIDIMAKDLLPEKMQQAVLAGLKEFQQTCTEAMGKNFQALEPTEREAYLMELEKTGKTREQDTPAFFPMMKQATLAGYFTSEIGATQALAYTPVPGGYEPCVDLQDGQKAWAM